MSKIFHQIVKIISPTCQRHITRLLKVAKNPTLLASTFVTAKQPFLGFFLIGFSG